MIFISPARLVRDIQLGIKNLLLHKLRSFLTMLGLVFGVGSVIAMLAVGEGASEVALEQIRKLGSRNITVNCIAPGFIDTDMTRALPDAARESLLGQIALGRLGRAEEIAAAVLFLASPAASYISGVTLHVNGGMYMS